MVNKSQYQSSLKQSYETDTNHICNVIVSFLPLQTHKSRVNPWYMGYVSPVSIETNSETGINGIIYGNMHKSEKCNCKITFITYPFGETDANCNMQFIELNIITTDKT